MSLVDQHPRSEELEAFALGRLEDDLFAAVEEHVAGCSDCEAVVSRIAGDTFTALLQSAQSLSDTPKPLAEATFVEEIRGESGATSAWATAGDEGPADLPAALVSSPRYLPVRLLGHGGMGTVWLAEHRVMRRQVAVKAIRPEFMAKAGAVERFRREAQAAARLNHPNIVAAFDAEQAGDTHLLAMEYIEGINLADELHQRGPLPVAEACDVVRQAAVGLQHAFSCGLIHRDLKPHNLMRTADGTVKILDFGLAVLADAGEQEGGLTGQNVVLGTPDYIAPEQAEDSHAVDVRSDIYSLGCTLYHLLTGRVPFPGDSVLRKLDAHRKLEPEPLRTLRPEVPAELAAVVARMMAKSPADRYQTPAEVAAVLAPFAAGTTPVRKRPRPWVTVAALLCAGLIAAAGVVYYIKTDNGTIEIRTDDENVKIIAERNGKQVTVLDPKSKQTWVVDTGAWTLRLDGAPDGLKIEIPDKFTLKRGDNQIVTVRRVKGAERIVVKPADEEKVGEVRRFAGHTQAVWGVAFSPDGRYALSTSSDWGIRLWNLKSGKEVRSYLEHTDHTHAVAFSPDGSEFLSCGQDRTIRHCNVATGKELNRAELGTEMLADVVLSPDGKLALVASFDKTLYLWDVKDWKEIRRFEGHTGQVQRVVFSADGRRALSAGWDKTLRLWDVETGKELKCFEGHEGYVIGVALSPDGRLALSGGHGDKPLRLWDVATGKELRQFEGHKDDVGGVAFSPDGRLALSGSADCSVRLWEVGTGKELHRFDGHQAGVYSVAFSPDGHYALSSSGDRTMRLWRLPDLQNR